MAEATETRHKTMRFRHRLYDMRYVIVPDDSGRDNWGQVRRIQGIAAKFDNYFFDSGAAQRVYRWDDDTREMVEKYLLTHEDFNKRGGRGFFLDIGQDIPSYYLEELGEVIKLDPFAQAVAGIPGPDARLMCTVTVITPGGPAELCGRDVREGHRFCSLHEEYEEEADLTVTPDDEGPDEFDEAIAVAQEDPRDKAIAELNAKFEQLLAAVAGAQLGVVVEDEPEPEEAPKPKPVTKMRVPTKKG